MGGTPSSLIRINLGPHQARNTFTRRISVELIKLHLVDLGASTQNVLQRPCLRNYDISVYAVPGPQLFNY